MKGLPQIRDIGINDYIDEINKSIDNKNYLSALSLTLMIPDMCSKVIGLNKKSGYVKWFNKYVYRNYYDIPKKKQIKKADKRVTNTLRIKFNGNTCYALRCSILHSGNSYVEFENKKDKIKANIDRIELCVNGNSDRENQYGESVSIVSSNYDEKKDVRIRINIVNFADTMIKGYKDFLEEIGQDDILLFPMIDWDKKGQIIFTPK